MEVTMTMNLFPPMIILWLKNLNLYILLWWISYRCEDEDEDVNDIFDDVHQSVSAVDCTCEALCSLSSHNVHKLLDHHVIQYSPD